MTVKGAGSCCSAWLPVGDDDDHEDGGIGLCDSAAGAFSPG